MKPSRCRCGRGLTRKALHQEVPERIKGRSFKVGGRHLVKAGHQQVCGSCGPQRTAYR